MGELTAQAGTSNCKTWYENEFQVSYETWPQTRSFSYQVLQSSFLEKDLFWKCEVGFALRPPETIAPANQSEKLECCTLMVYGCFTVFGLHFGIPHAAPPLFF